ncbi:MAG: ABC-F family ATP-binding cassette domain-containing protein [Clostridia bacterium]|jgi:ATP-binding cassette subfamily F protein 3|nr:ABC-F family ATP-binding cassette domain-containing protein [Clostridia bacterium]MCI2000037.1 ABC-F family ATP-binding cassette domain-containing protein [Clostridia bacterium]MCI2014429.1 ABC-F family ATP-binding cassette domain-containing protein [Clostridia bacterium]
MIFSCSNIHKSYGTEVILEKITFNIEEREKAAIVGVNGAGKTTLFKIITGEISSDSGEIYLKKGIKLGYLSQHTVFEGESTIYNEILKVFSPILDIEKRLREMEQKMSSLSGNELEKHMESYSNLQHEFELKDGYSYKSRIKGVLKGLGFSESDYDRPIKELSGGQKTRVFLGRLLLSNPEMLLLDEPTNHLDIESISWLEDFLKGYNGAVIIISHDRYFLDKIVTKTIEIENKKSYIYEGNYTFYAKQKAVNRQIEMNHFEQQQREIKHQEEVIAKLRSFNREKSIKRAESREKALEKMEITSRPENLPEKMRLTFTPKITSGNDVLHVEGLSKAFTNKPLFSNVDIDIKRGEKVALIGPNGIGKSTLLKILLGIEHADSGTYRLGTNVNIGYYDQEQHNFDETKTIFQEISDTYPTLTNGEIRNILAAFVFEGDDVFKVISSLSGGERGRVSLAKIFLSKSNFLILDEPTNHLDIYSKEILEDALNRYEGTVFYISHDRYFINKTAQKIYELSPTGARLFLGNYDYYVEKKNNEEREKQLFEQQAETEKPAQSPTSTKLSWQAQKEQQAKDRKLKNKIEKIEKEIEEADEKISGFDELLATNEIATDYTKAQEIFKQKEETQKYLEELYDKWEELQS